MVFRKIINTICFFSKNPSLKIQWRGLLAEIEKDILFHDEALLYNKALQEWSDIEISDEIGIYGTVDETKVAISCFNNDRRSDNLHGKIMAAAKYLSMGDYSAGVQALSHVMMREKPINNGYARTLEGADAISGFERDYLDGLISTRGYIKSGYQFIDDNHSGYPVGVTGILAPSQHGKTSFALRTIKNAIDNKLPFFGCFTEESPKKVVANLIPFYHNIKRSDIQRGIAPIHTVGAHAQDLKARMSDNQIFSNERDISKICNEMRLWRSNTDINTPALCILDYFTNITIGNKTVSDEQVARHLFSIISDLALELNLSIILLTQVKREFLKELKWSPDYTLRFENSYFGRVMEDGCNFLLTILNSAKLVESPSNECMAKIYVEKVKNQSSGVTYEVVFNCSRTIFSESSYKSVLGYAQQTTATDMNGFAF